MNSEKWPNFSKQGWSGKGRRDKDKRNLRGPHGDDKENKLNSFSYLKGSTSTQTDGFKLRNSSIHNRYGDMSQQSRRSESFRSFPHKGLMHSLIESGYFYTGVDDRTICHECFAEVYDWNEKDNPMAYHEPNCSYHANTEVMEQDPISPQESPHLSLLDTPNPETSSSVPPPLIPPPTVPVMNVTSAYLGPSIPPSKHRDYDFPTANLFHPGMNHSQSGRNNNLPILQIADVIDEAHRIKLGCLNLYKEKDRRETFDNLWSENTNDVVDPLELASDGLFYLGNLDRTQCFSCQKVINAWAREDIVSVVHRNKSPECRMVQKTDPRNIPISAIQYIHQPRIQPILGDPSFADIQISNGTETSHSSRTENSDAEAMEIQTPLDLTVGTSQAGARGVNATNQESNLRKVGVPQKIKIPMQISGSSEQSPADSNSPISPVPPLPELSLNSISPVSPVPPVSPLREIFSAPEPNPRHLGQTTLYNPSNASTETSSLPMPGPSGTPLEPIQPVQDANPWAETFPCDDPDNPEMGSTITREDTFDNRWTMRGISNTADIARAGFYAVNAGVRTRAKCWYCGGVAYEWNQRDDPWEKHVSIRPNCEFLLRHKGPEYVAEVSSRRPPSPVRPPTPMFRRDSTSSSDEESPAGIERVLRRLQGQLHAAGAGLPYLQRPWHQEAPPRVVDPKQEEARHKRMLNEALNSNLVLGAIEMGFDTNVIKRTVKKKIQNSDAPFTNADELLEALLNPPDESSSESEEEEPQTSAPSTSGGLFNTGQSTNISVGSSTSSKPATSFEGAENLDPTKLDEKLREYEQEKRCKVCLDRDTEVVFFPCGHLCTCTDCAVLLRNCPLCRKRIQKSMKVYTS